MNFSKRAACLAIAALSAGTPVASAQSTLQVAGKDYKLEHVAAYETKSGNEKETVVLLCAKPIPSEELKDKLKRGSADSFFIFEPQVQLTFDEAAKLSSVFIWADNNSISTGGTMENDKVEASFKDGKAKGKVAMAKEDGDPKYRFEASFDVPLLKVAESKPQAR
jgi:hypothetical protein